ncbi:MAG: hypothetical protein COZ18_12615 [Flexibacter sp. CG_4_10_14_3_um_filter_32_15]|nr:MAG: hypothetical protein COZ18_12615 [Flexibacter sp. CG_4_10_14_3_um_filter_32_15]
MYKNYIIGVLLSCLFLINQNAFAQVEPCATNTKHQEMLAADENYRATFEKMQADLQRHIAEKMANAATHRTEATVYNIPVVVHVIHTGDAIGTIYNPSVANINAMLGKINTDFRNTTFGADVEINFTLAQRAPDCNATTGINRVDGSGLANYVAGGVGTGGAADADVKALSIWSNTDYYNIWIVNKINGNDGTSGSFTAGYAYFPGAGSDVDGAVVLATQVDGTSTTMTHEFGHAFALQHTFHKAETGDDSANATDCPLNTDCTTQGDLICDTDPHGYMLGACDGGNCGGVNAATLDNYMSYCSGTSRFTPNQVTRMRTALETQRGGLISSLGATAPSGTLPVAACTPAATGTFSGFGVTNFNFKTLNISSRGSDPEGNYVNRVCGQGTTVLAGANESFTIETSVNTHNVKVYIDYNNDGDFTDADELIITGVSSATTRSANSSGTLFYHEFSTNYTFPATGILFNQPLRMRVVTDWTGRAPATLTSCSVSEGQAEDFSITIQSAVTNTITLGTITPTTYCAGSVVEIPFTTSGTFAGGNIFAAQLSDATGNFGTPTATQTGTSPISLTVPTTATTSTNYKVRVIASDPTTTSNESANITINALPLDRTIVANPASITTGNTTNIDVPNSENGVSYQLQDASNGNANVGTAVAGDGGTINLPTGNLTATTNFRVVATNTTTTCSRTLNTVTVTVNAAAPTITLNFTPSGYCAGNVIEIAFNTTGTFAGGNTFTAQLSDNTGSFAAPIATQTGASPISLTSPIAATPSSNYKVRVVASDPTTTSNESAAFDITPTPEQRTIVATNASITTGTSTTINVPNSQTGVNYQLLKDGGPEGSPVAGTGADLLLNTGTLTANTNFSVMAEHATSLCPADFNTVTVTVTAATGNITNIQQSTFYTTIQAAVDAANDGETLKILVNNTYNEDVTITNKSLTITSDATDYTQITVKQIIFNGTGKTLTISTHMGISEVLRMQNGDVVVTGGSNFALRSTAAGTALVINDSPSNTVQGNVIMERFISASSTIPGFGGAGQDGLGYRLFSSPFSDATISQFGDDMASGLVLNTAYNTAPEPAFVRPFPTFFQYEETNNGATTSAYYNPFIANYKVPTTPNLTPARGYQANIASGVTVDLNGTLNNGSLTIGLTNSGGDGYNLVGNPYPSPISWESVYTANADVLPVGISAEVQFDIPIGQYEGSFASYTAGTGVSNNGGKNEIAVMQGFFVRATQPTGIFKLHNSARLGTDTRFLKTTETKGAKEGLVRVALQKDGIMDETTIYFQKGATPAYDAGFDAGKLHKINSKYSTLYSYNENAELGNNEYFSINGLGSFDAEQQLPLAMNIVTDGEYEITLRTMKYFHSKHELYLYDSLTDSLHNLRVEGDYKFTAKKGNEIKRFMLLFKTEANAAFFENERVRVYPNPTPNQFSYSLKTDREGNYTVRLFDATGRIILEENKTKEGAFLEGTIDLEKHAAGLYLLQVSDSEKTTAVRVVKE